jgi:membrane-associated PAP2 superfamily phosphatase
VGFSPKLLNPVNSQEEVMTWFKGQAADFYDSGIQKLVPRHNKCLDNAGDYVEKQSYVQCRFCKLKMLYMFKNFETLLSGHASYVVLFLLLATWLLNQHVKDENLIQLN